MIIVNELAAWWWIGLMMMNVNAESRIRRRHFIFYLPLVQLRAERNVHSLHSQIVQPVQSDSVPRQSIISSLRRSFNWWLPTLKSCQQSLRELCVDWWESLTKSGSKSKPGVQENGKMAVCFLCFENRHGGAATLYYSPSSPFIVKVIGLTIVLSTLGTEVSNKSSRSNCTKVSFYT